MSKKPIHYLGRPPEPLTDCLRLAANGRWVKDDGKTPGRAFSGRSVTGQHTIPFPMAVGPDCEWCSGPDCPSRMVMDKTVARFGAANGRCMKRPRKGNR